MKASRIFGVFSFDCLKFRILPFNLVKHFSCPDGNKMKTFLIPLNYCVFNFRFKEVGSGWAVYFGTVFPGYTN